MEKSKVNIGDGIKGSLKELLILVRLNLSMEDFKVFLF